ncbi:PEP-CTERM sorting domain-containing protein [Roseisolibacter agri]|uniref:Ice-binding protein C-terminal domain-containing protein n=1 Tax=Roseisolibacter agri TaxID=2014610 RepID=A0AA37QAR5_9BACT|nr:PEP-CTERM sorting domain-containing protein [Roseisolibacter agri]GLC27862.1 hypothetical protein rosag_43750 [Roseisolibacter agri]
MSVPFLSRAASRLALVALTLAAPLAGALHAQTIHFGAGARDAFLAAATTPVTNGIASAGPTYDFGALGTGTVSGNGIATTNGNIFASGGGLPVPAYTIGFSSTLGAFGADFTGLGTINADFPFPAGVAEFTFFNGASTVGTVTQNFGSTGATVFFGVTGLAAFDRVQVRTNVGDEFLTDDVVIGAALVATPPATTVPEPTTVVLVGAGLLGVVGVSKRRAHA